MSDNDGTLFRHGAICAALEPASTAPAGTFTPFSRVVHARLSDAMLQASDLLTTEVRDLMAESDTITPTTAGSPAEYATTMWGADGPRMRAAVRLMGDIGDTDIRIVSSANRTELGPTLSDGALTVVHAPIQRIDGRVRRVLQLLQRYDVPVGIEENAETGQRRFATVASTDAFAKAVLGLLDHRIAADAYLPLCTTSTASGTLCSRRDYTVDDGTTAISGTGMRARDELTEAQFDEFGSTTLAMPVSNSPLRVLHGVTLQDVQITLAHVRNVFLTMSVRHTAHAQVTRAGGWSFLAVRALETKQRFALSLMDALAEDRGTASAWFRADPAEPTTIPLVSGAMQTLPFPTTIAHNWYQADIERTSRLGASGALHQLRVHVLRLLNLPEASNVERSFIDRALLGEVLEMLQAQVGASWTEWDGYPALPTATMGDGGVSVAWPSYVACVGTDCNTPTTQALTASEDERVWSVYYDDTVTRYDSGSPVFVRTEEDAQCLLSSPLGAFTCDADEIEPTAMTATDGSDAFAAARLGVSRKSYSVPRSAWSASMSAPYYDHGSNHLYVLWKTVSGAVSEYELVDVIRPSAESAVHPFGGSLGTLFAQVVARDTTNPAMPAYNSLGLPNDYVPPTENELTSNGNDREDSYEQYLSWSEQATATAAELVEDARSLEISAMQETEADDAYLEDAELQAEHAVASGCGTASGLPDCNVARGNYTLWQLGMMPSFSAAAPWEANASSERDTIPGPDDMRADLWRREGDTTEQPLCVELIADLMGRSGAGYNVASVSGPNWGVYTKHYFKSALDCTRWLVLSGLGGVQVRDVPVVVANAVIAERLDPTGGVETYDEYEGELQQRLLDMHRQLSALRASLEDFETTYRMALRQVDLVERSLDDLGDRGTKVRCKLKKAFEYIGMMAAGAVAIIGAAYTGGASLAALILIIVAEAATFTQTSIEMAQGMKNDECSNKDDAQRLGEQALTQLLDTLSTMRSYQATTATAVRQFAAADSQMDAMVRSTQIARARTVIEGHIRSSNSLADMPEWRVLQGVTASRARDAVHRAQVYAFIARRAIEYRLPVSLVASTAQETFVDPGARWANDVFLLHTASTESSAQGEFAHTLTSDEALRQYNRNLRGFVQGYGFTRPFSNGTDVQILNLNQLVWRAPADPMQAFHQRLAYKCNNASGPQAWEAVAENPSVATSRVCTSQGGVEYAELTFEIPVSMTGYFGDKLATGSYNYRHRQLVVNFVGPMKECSLATWPSECQHSNTLFFGLRQSGEVTIESYERDHLWFNGDAGVIRSGRAWAANQELARPMSSMATAATSQLWRRELSGRPLTGSYTIRVLGRPEIVWSGLSNIQILLEYGYWTRQE